MKTDNPFDQKIELLLSSSKERSDDRNIRNAAIYVNDTLDLALASAQAVFEDKATPELALQIFDRIDAERQRLESLEADQGDDDD